MAQTTRRALWRVKSILSDAFPSSSPVYDVLDSDESDGHRYNDNHELQSARLATQVQRAQTKGQRTSRSVTLYKILLGIAVTIILLGLLGWTVPRSASDTAQKGQRWKPFGENRDNYSPKPRALVLASYSMQDVSWLSHVPDQYDVFRYLNDDPVPAHSLTIPRQQGREAMSYLSYIIDHYPNFSPITFFLHGDERSWHMPEPVMLKAAALNTTALAVESFINLRCNLFPACTEDTLMSATKLLREDDERIAAKVLPSFYQTMFPPEQDWGMGPAPEILASACCSQFAVTREMLLSRPRKFYEFYRRPLLRDLEEFEVAWGALPDNYAMGVIYERFWHMLFGRPAHNCVDTTFCKDVHFQNAIECTRDTSDPAVNEDWVDIECHLRPNFS